MIIDEIRIPVSRFRRELNKWLRYINKNKTAIVLITKNKIDIGATMSEDLYEKLGNKNEDSIRRSRSS